MRPALLWLSLAAAIIAILLLYRSRSATQLQVTPDARDQIEKAKRR